ncbi:HEAT repeat domain-containing protein [Bremerella sp. P1]|uniref:HEAT repeat domain-containing protein n=1 Tax=Bremerella sp. P1 TaxID=3026424 RepID=UPI002368D9A0|nr:HEAT repeat domain-containing protein [Bremerella sp. P1]WDI40462.1 HEAT repeat domain-containing protein [Bremerella sp. P1]
MQHSNESHFRPVKTTVILLGMLLLLAVGFSIMALWYLLPARMDTILLNAPESEIPKRMEYALRHSSTPYHDLARWMGSDRPIIALEATQQMQARIDRLQAEPGLAIANQAYQLAEALNDELPNYPQQTRGRVHLMASQMSNWDLGMSSPKQGPFLILLEDMIRDSRPTTSSTDLAASDQMVMSYLKQQQPGDTALESPSQLQQMDELDLRGGLPWKQQSIPGEPQDALATQPAIKVHVHSDSEVLPANRRVAIDRPLKLPTLVQSPKQLPPGLHPTEPLPDFSHLTTLEIMWKLHLQNTRMVKHARETLIARNFNAEDLELATRLTHPDVTQRLQLVRELPVMPREDRTHWLYYMTKDPDEGVRYSAAAALLTSTDPRLLRRLKADMATDPSPRVQALIRR